MGEEWILISFLQVFVLFLLHLLWYNAFKKGFYFDFLQLSDLEWKVQ